MQSYGPVNFVSNESTSHPTHNHHNPATDSKSGNPSTKLQSYNTHQQGHKGHPSYLDFKQTRQYPHYLKPGDDTQRSSQFQNPSSTLPHWSKAETTLHNNFVRTQPLYQTKEEKKYAFFANH